MDRVVLVGVDWGEQKHVYQVRTADGRRGSGSFESKPEAVHEWVRQLRAEYPAGTIEVAVELDHGPLIYALSEYEFVRLVPVQPARTSAYRRVARPSGAKSDPIDAELICDYVEKHSEIAKPLVRADPLTRELEVLVEWRRKFVFQRVELCQQLRDTLKQYYPQALAWCGELGSPMSLAFLEAWPTLEALQRSKDATVHRFFTRHGSRSTALIERRLSEMAVAVPLHTDRSLIAAHSMVMAGLVPMIRVVSEQIASLDARIAVLWDTHPDRAIFESLPGAGAALAPRLAVALGMDRSRWTASTLQTYSGIAPVISQSGQRRWVHSRWRCPKFLRQTFHEFAEYSIPHCSWAGAFYRSQRQRGKGHHAAIRALAFRWIRIIVRCWTDRLPYDHDRYIRRLARAGSPFAATAA
jgi:transposase